MGEVANGATNTDRIHAWIRDKVHVLSPTLNGTSVNRPTDIPLSNTSTHHNATTLRKLSESDNKSSDIQTRATAESNVADKTTASPPPAPPPVAVKAPREEPTSVEPGSRPNIVIRFFQTTKDILLSTWLNVLLVFVPIGIAVQFAGVSPTIVFAMNAIAIIPLAGLLSHATESVASNMGDTIGALMNVTFGNAVELIIFIALVKNELRIVQASLLGSILANLLLILGMCFLFGGLRFQEQIYNSKITQMSACLLSLSVMSLLLPTAFHASFTDYKVADRAVLQVSRGTSIILLLVYVLYLLFQLKSHAYIYTSTPQHVIDEESHPGVLADMLGSSTSSTSSSSSSSSDTDGSSNSNTTAKRLKRAFRGRRRRKSSASSKDSPSIPSVVRTPSAGTSNGMIEATTTTSGNSLANQSSTARPTLGAIMSGDEADTDGENAGGKRRRRRAVTKARDARDEKGSCSPQRTARRSTKRKHKNVLNNKEDIVQASDSDMISAAIGRKDFSEIAERAAPRVGFIDSPHPSEDVSSQKRPFNIRVLSRPTLPKVLSNNVFTSNGASTSAFSNFPAAGINPNVSNGIRRANSLPERLDQAQAFPTATSAQPLPHIMPAIVLNGQLESKTSGKAKKFVSRNTAILLLLISTGLVALCAEFLVGSINYLVANTDVSEAFIGLIVLPIVGNAAEHVSAVTVAGKNKMDLALGIAVGSSIQIALFVTPIIVLLGWCMNKDMSLYFNLFETISLFVSAFIVNFLVLDGRSNYLEGALLIAAYIIIALAAFFFPDSSQQSSLGGSDGVVETVKRMML